MRVTCLGKSPAWQDEGGACTGYLVEEGETTLLLDCGNGVFAKLRERIDYLDLDATIVSHVHADHWIDLVPYSYALAHSPRLDPDRADADVEARPRPRPALHCPPGSIETFDRVTSAWGSPGLIASSFDVEEYSESGEVRVGPLVASFRLVPHYVETFAVSISSDSGTRFVFGADCEPNDALVEHARDAALLIAEATLTHQDPDPDDRGHLTPFEAGEIGRRAGVERLALTHYVDEVDPEWIRAEAERGFGGPVILAEAGEAFEL